MKRRNGILLKRNRGPRIALELTEFNSEPEQLLALANIAQIEYAAAKAKWQYTLDREKDNEPHNKEDCEECIARAAQDEARRIGWIS